MLLSITKNEIIYSLYISSFEQIKKNLDKKDKNFTAIQTICDNLNQSKKILFEDNNLEKYSLILINVLDFSTNKIFEIILKLFCEILKNNLIYDIILQKIIPKLLHKINNNIENKEFNYKIYQKILLMIEMIYNNTNIFIHNNFKIILDICIKISIKENQNTNNNKSIVYQTLIFFVKKIFDNLPLTKDNPNNSSIDDISFFIKKYLDFLLDLIEIQSIIGKNDKNIINAYIEIISVNNKSMKTEIEKLNLDTLNIYKNKDKIKIGKYGWCIYCNNESNNFSEELNLPICNIFQCEKNLKNISSNNIYYINDYFDMILFLSNIKSDNIKTIELCLEIIKEMLNSGSKYFNKDEKMIEIIKSIFKDFIIKNSLSPNIKIFKLSLDIFNIIFIDYREKLKIQIENFFMKIFINFLESEKRTFNYKEIIINNLFFLLDKIGINFLIEIYLNYDCDSKYNAIFCVLFNLFVKIKNGLYQHNKYGNTFNNADEINVIINKIDDFLNMFIIRLNDFLIKKIGNYDLNNNCNENINNEEHNKIFTYLKENNFIISEDLFNQMKSIFIEDYNNNTIKKDYSNIFQKQEKSNNLSSFILNIPKNKLSKINYIDYTSYEIANFLLCKSNNFPKINIKSILYNENEIKILYYYIQIISPKFKNKNILESLYILFSFFPLTKDEKTMNNIILIFSEIYYNLNINNISFDINDIYYISFFLYKLNNDLHINEIKQKITQENFIQEIKQYIDINKENNIINLFNYYYNQISQEPFKFNDTLNNKENVIEKKEKIYIIDIKKNDIRKFMEFSWNNLLNIKIQSINESISKNNKEVFFTGLNHVLIVAKICGILNLSKAQENYLNIIINMINLNEKSEISEIIIEIIVQLMNYINDNCHYIKCNWDKILKIISLLEYNLLEPEKNIILNLKNSSQIKYTEKEIKFFLNKRNILSMNISDAVCESIFSKTELFENKIIINFIKELCIISQFELDSYYIPRLFSLNKLVELIHFNLFRSQFYFQQVWGIISHYLGNVVIKYNNENIWKQVLDIIKQIVGKILEKKEYLNSGFDFQENIFIIFENIFKEIEINKTNNNKQEGIIDIVYFIIMQYGKSINYGWKNIFNLIKIAFVLNNNNINNNIINILKYINNNSKNIFYKNNNDITIFEKYIEFLCFIYNQKTLKHIAFETFTEILNKIIDNENIILKTPSSNKIYKLINILLYSIDSLLKINIIEYLNLLFEIMHHYKKIILSEDLNIFIYIYYTYFKPNISLMILSKYINRIDFLNKAKNGENNFYNYLLQDNEINIMQNYIEKNINILINDFNNKEGKEYNEIFYNDDNAIKNKNKLCGFLIEIKKEITNNKFNELIKKRINNVKDIDENNYENLIKYFLEKFKNMFIMQNNNKESDKKYINYNYFYSDLILTIQQLSIFTLNSDLIYKILFKIISSSPENISIFNKNKLIENNHYILKIISCSEMNSIDEKDIFKYLKYILDFSNYFLDFIQIFNFDFTPSLNLILKLFNNILLLDLNNENNLDKNKIINSSSVIVLLMKLQDIQLYILNKTKKENLIKIKNEKNNNIIYLNQIYEKYLMNKDVNSLLNKIYIFELENLLLKFVEYFNKNELENIYQFLINLICSINHNIRKGSKNILKFLVENKLIILTNINK